MANTDWKVYDCKLQYARVFEHNMDMGGDDNDAAQKVKATEGQFVTNMIVDEATKAQMIADGIPDVSMGYTMFKEIMEGEGDNERPTGEYIYRVKRPNLSPFKDDDGNPQYFGPPNIVDYNATVEAGEQVKWDPEVLLGNGTTAKVKLSIYKNGKKRIIRLESIGVLDLVEYEPQDQVRF